MVVSITLTPAEIATATVPPAALIDMVSMSSRLVAVTATPRKPVLTSGVRVRCPVKEGSVVSVLPFLSRCTAAASGSPTSPSDAVGAVPVLGSMLPILALVAT